LKVESSVISAPATKAFSPAPVEAVLIKDLKIPEKEFLFRQSFGDPVDHQ